MKPKQKKKLKKLGSLLAKSAKGLSKGAKGTSKFVGKYGPKVHAASRRMSETTMDAMIPRRTKAYVDLTAKKKPTRVVKRKRRGDFYLDFSK